MDMVDMVGYVLTAVTVGSTCVPLLLLRRSTRLSAQELRETHPELNWVARGFRIYQLACASAVFLTCWLLQKSLGIGVSDYLFYWLAASVGALMALSGLFSIVTGVYDASVSRWTYRYVCDDKARRAGVLQAVLGIVVMIAAYFAFDRFAVS